MKKHTLVVDKGPKFFLASCIQVFEIHRCVVSGLSLSNRFLNYLKTENYDMRVLDKVQVRRC